MTLTNFFFLFNGDVNYILPSVFCIENIYLSSHLTLLQSHNDIYKLTKWSCSPKSTMD